MRKKAQSHVSHERWLVSYADFITLLFAFFVVLFASSRGDKRKQVQVADAMKSAFTEMGVFEPHSKTLAIGAAGGASTTGKPKPIALSAADQTPEQLKKALDQMIDGQVSQGKLAKGSVTTHITPDGLVISLHDAGFFASGSSEVNASSLHILTTIVSALPNRPIRVEGHTDNVPIHTQQFATNWELSTARASAIARFIIDRRSIDADKLSAAGYAEFHPVATNDTDEGRTQTRRVDIIVLSGQVS